MGKFDIDLVIIKKVNLSSIKQIVKIFFSFNILIPVLISGIIYFFVTLYFKKIGLWQITMLKDSIVWFCFTGILIIFQIEKVKEFSFKQILAESLGFLIIIEYLISAYNFSLIKEFFLIPLMFVLGAMSVIAEKDNKTKIIAKFFNLVISAYVIFVLYLSIKNVIKNPDGVFQSFIYNILTIIIFIFIRYFVAVYSAYERLFININNYVKNNKLGKKLKWRYFLYAKLNIRRINKCIKYLNCNNIKSEKDIDILFKNMSS